MLPFSHFLHTPLRTPSHRSSSRSPTEPETETVILIFASFGYNSVTKPESALCTTFGRSRRLDRLFRFFFKLLHTRYLCPISLSRLMASLGRRKVSSFFFSFLALPNCEFSVLTLLQYMRCCFQAPYTGFSLSSTPYRVLQQYGARTFSFRVLAGS